MSRQVQSKQINSFNWQFVTPAHLAFFFVVATWSTSWIAVKYQLTFVPINLSVAYRFFAASIILFIIAKVNKFPLKFSLKQHHLIFWQGINLFFFNHLFFYSAINYVSSGIAAIFASLAVVFVPLIDFLIHKNKNTLKIFLGGFLGIIGVAFIASSEVDFANLNLSNFKGLILCLGGVLSFSFGNIIAKNLQLSNIKTLISSTSYSMLYGSLFSFIFAIFKGQNVSFDFSFSYIFSLLYLILLPGILGYCSILYLIEKVGSAKASYTALFYPIIALIISAIFENYQFTYLTFLGIFLVLIGNLIALKSR